MKWDVKHDRAKRVIDAFLDNAAYWEERPDLSEGLSEEEKAEVNAELALMIASIRKRYKLEERLTEVKAPAPAVEEKPAEKVAETAEIRPEVPAEKPKRGRKPAGEKKESTRKPRTKKSEVVA